MIHVSKMPKNKKYVVLESPDVNENLNESLDTCVNMHPETNLDCYQNHPSVRNIYFRKIFSCASSKNLSRFILNHHKKRNSGILNGHHFDAGLFSMAPILSRLEMCTPAQS